MAFAILEQGRDHAVLAHSSTTCPMFRSQGKGRGTCTAYATRPVICRVFGFSARLTRQQSREAYMCHVLKEQFAHVFRDRTHVAYAPLVNEFYGYLTQIDSQLTSSRYRISEAIPRALQLVKHVIELDLGREPTSFSPPMAVKNGGESRT